MTSTKLVSTGIAKCQSYQNEAYCGLIQKQYFTALHFTALHYTMQTSLEKGNNKKVQKFVKKGGFIVVVLISEHFGRVSVSGPMRGLEKNSMGRGQTHKQS